jgi:hypothetical protein
LLAPSSKSIDRRQLLLSKQERLISASLSPHRAPKAPAKPHDHVGRYRNDFNPSDLSIPNIQEGSCGFHSDVNAPTLTRNFYHETNMKHSKSITLMLNACLFKGSSCWQSMCQQRQTLCFKPEICHIQHQSRWEETQIVGGIDGHEGLEGQSY